MDSRKALFIIGVILLVSSCNKEDADEVTNAGNNVPVFGACFTYSIDGGIVSFNADCSVDADTYSWDFGNNQNSQEMNPVHEYIAAETYNVTLIITGADGATDSNTQSFTLEEYCETCRCSLNGQSQSTDFCGTRQAAERFCDACNNNTAPVSCNCL